MNSTWNHRSFLLVDSGWTLVVGRLLRDLPILSTLLCLLLSATSATSQEAERTWSDSSGKFTVQATLIEADRTAVRLQTKDGRTIRVPRGKLSKADLNYLESRSASASGVEKESKNISPKETHRRLQQFLSSANLPARTSPLKDFASSLPVPVFIDQRALDTIGLSDEVPIKIVAAASVPEQLDSALSASELSFYTLQTILVISSEQAVRNIADVRIYRFPVRGNDYATYAALFQQVEPDSWLARGGTGSMVPFPPLFVVRQTPLVHRALTREKRVRALAHQYRHPLDQISVSIAAEQIAIGDIAEQLSKQIGTSITVAPEVAKLGADKARLSFSCSGVSAKDALDIVTGQLECTWVEVNEGLSILPRSDASERQKTSRLAIPFGNPRDFDTTMNVIMQSVAPDSWIPMGGSASIKAVGGRRYQIEQSQPAMRELNQLLFDLRAAF